MLESPWEAPTPRRRATIAENTSAQFVRGITLSKRAIWRDREPAANWLNDHTAPRAPATLDVDACEAFLESGRLLVLGLPLRDIFVMKLNRGDPLDPVDP